MKNIILNKGMRGPIVSFLQLTLFNANVFKGEIDGIFGSITENAVKTFQTLNNLTSNGIVDETTWNSLLEYMTVPTTIPYTYEILMLNIKSFSLKYPSINIGSIGTSVLGRDIPYLKLGNGKKEMLYVAGTHANEWICCTLLMKFIEDFFEASLNNLAIKDIFPNQLLNEVSIYIIPMLNPDGVNLVTNPINKKSKEYLLAKNIADKYPNIRFPDGWKANISGIDLNLQFPAEWEKAKEIKFSQGYTTYAPRDFVGNYPLEAPEAIAIYDFTLQHNFQLMLTYHSQGQVIYWKFLDYTPPNSLTIGLKMSELSGYTLEDTPYASSFAGFKDWFIQNYNLPGYTIEVGIGTNPLPLSQFDKIYSDNIGILISIPKILLEYK